MAAVYILYMFQKMFLGPQGSIVEEAKKHGHALRDLNWREIATMVPLLIFIFWIGLYPEAILQSDGPGGGQTRCRPAAASIATPGSSARHGDCAAELGAHECPRHSTF